MKATASEIREAIAATGGNVARAAAALGIARKNLYNRLSALEVDLGAARAAARGAAPPRPAQAPRPAGPLRQARSFHLRPEHLRALDDASLDLAALMRERLSASRVMEMFLDACFAEWVARQLATKPGARS